MINKITDRKKVILMISVMLFLFLIAFAFKSKEETVLEEPIIEKQEKIVNTETIQVDIKGAVKTPGVYEMEADSRVKDVIDRSGGLLETAYLNTINLSKKVEDEMVIIIYTEKEIKDFLEEETRTLKQENTCICPKVENGACIKEAITNKQTNEKANTTKQVSLNYGTKEEFETLSGIGSAKASAIIEYRNEHGKFNSIEEIKNVSGIGEATYAKIKQYLTL